MKNAVSQHLNSQRSSYNFRQKGMIIFCVIALILCAFLPFLTITSFEGEIGSSYTIFTLPYLRKTSAFFVFIFAFLLARNASPRRRQKIHQFVGFKDNEALVNAGGLLSILLALLTTGDTLMLLKQTFSYRIEPTRGLFALQIYILAGLVRNILLARYEHNQKRNSHEVTIAHEHEERSKDAFKHVEKEFGALFGHDEGNPY